MNETNNLRVITLKDLWTLFVQRIVPIILAAVIVVGAFAAYNLLLRDPRYASTATLYILHQSEREDSTSSDAVNEVSLALRLVYDCDYLLKSRTVLNEVIETLNLDMTYEQLYERITTVNPENTRVLEITVEGDSPEQAKAIVDMICDIGPGRIAEAMGYSQVNRYEYGTLPEYPSNSPGLLIYAVVAVAAAVLTYGVFLMIFLLDDRIRTDEDIKRELGLSVLAEIPDMNDNSRSAYGYYRRGRQTTTRKRS